MSQLPFVDAIYVITNARLTQRHGNVKTAPHHQEISTDSIKWKMNWNRTTCNGKSTRSYIYKRMNLKNTPLSKLIFIHIAQKITQ